MNWRQGSEGETQGHVGEIAGLAAIQGSGRPKVMWGRSLHWRQGSKREIPGHVGKIYPTPEPLKLFLASEEDKASKSKIY